MKITDFKTYVINTPLRNLIFVKVFTDEGLYGVGEATIEWKVNAAFGAFEDIRPHVVGKDPERIEWFFFDCFRKSYWHTDPCTLSAIAALETACVDITGKKYNMPAYQLFGGKVHDRIRIYVNGWCRDAKTPAEYAQKAKEAVEKGAKALKWDPFGSSYLTITHETLDHVVNTMAAVREAVGPKIGLLIEAHGRFNMHTALQIAKELAPFKPYFMEEPVLPDIPEDIVEFHKRSPVPVAAGERLFGKTMFRQLISKNGADYVQPDMLHCGGMNELKKIGIMAEVQNIQIAPHNPSGPVATAAYLHICSTMPNFEFLEMMNDVPYRNEISTEKLEIEDGCIIVPDTPGLGIDIIPEECEKYPMIVQSSGIFTVR
ncbi:MAG: mandelate racemase/muconate lactonizing enzyme family protein [Peptococcaceae bacterium]|jgi:galactonate dehydratase|nr:mandelate racemase/muconate lactonizing enzyme family protein [Peptococcaceae bacterium]